MITNNSINPGGGAITIMLGNDDGTFQMGVTYPTTGTGTDSVVIDDFNGDGKLDLAAVSDTSGGGQQISILLGKGDGTFNAAQNFASPNLPGYTTSTPAAGLISGDFRNSGKKDLILTNGAEFLGNGDGTFTAAATPAFPYFATGSYVNLASGDINNDGKLDVVVSLGSTVSIYTGKGDGTFAVGNTYQTIGSTGYVAIDDLDGDGNQDIYIGLGDGGVYIGDSYDPNFSYVLMGHGDGTFDGAPALQPPTGGINQALSGYNGTNLADVNGDGYPDLIVQGSQTTFNVLLGSSAGTYSIGSTIQVPASITLFGHTITGATATSNPVVSDVNGDGKPDLIFVNNGLNPYMADGETALNDLPVYFVALNNGDGTFKAPIAYAFPSVATAPDYDNNLQVGPPAVANITAGGHGDIVFGFSDTVGGTSVANPFISGFLVLAGNGDGTFSGTPILTTTSSSSTGPAVALQPTVNALVDLNGDKKVDLVTITQNFSAATGGSTQLQVLLGNGDGTFQNATNVNVFSTGVQSSTYQLLFADFNADGKLDLACLNETYTASQAQLAIALGNGDGTFQAPALNNLSGGDVIRSSGIAAADYNADGKLDLALLDPGDLSGIYYGNGDGTFASISFNNLAYPDDLINLAVGGPAIATDLNKDGKPDILAGGAILLNTYGTATSTPPASSTTTLKASATTVTAGTSVTFTATVAGGAGSSGTPTGTVTFLDGTTTLGTGTLSSGVATYATSALAVGSHSVTAKYGGDTNFTSSTSSAVTITVNAAVPPSFTVGASPTSIAIAAAGGSGTTTLTVTPAGGFAQQVSFACTGLPSEASCTFAPTTVTPGSGAVTTTLTISTTAAHVVKGTGNDRSALKGFGTLASFALLILTFRPSRSRARWLVILAMLSAGVVMIGCGGGSGGSGGGGGGGGGGGTTDPGTPAGTSTVTVTATAGTLTQTVTLSVAVQ